MQAGQNDQVFIDNGDILSQQEVLFRYRFWLNYLGSVQKTREIYWPAFARLLKIIRKYLHQTEP